MGRELIQLIIGALAVFFGAITWRTIWKKHKKIDTESIAIVKEVIDLGRADARKVYAIKYDVKANEPFELLVTPCKKPLPVGKEKSVFYEKGNANKNYYFKSLGQLDSRLITPVFLTVIGIITVILAIISMF